MPEVAKKDAFVGVEALAALLGVSKSSVYRLVESERIPSYRVGGQLRFDVDEVLDALRSQSA